MHCKNCILAVHLLIEEVIRRQCQKFIPLGEKLWPQR